MERENIEWKVIKEAPEYEVSNYGDVRSLKNNIMLAGSVDKDGYPRVMLSTKGPEGKWDKSRRITRFRHRLVAEAFIDNPDNLPVINHIDENKANPYVGNLEWCTIKYNICYGEGAIKRREQIIKSQQNNPKLGYKVYVYDYNTHEFIGLFDSISRAAKDLNCDYRTIHKIVNHGTSRNQHHGKIFSYTPIEFES